MNKINKLLLFDVDGTICESGKKITLQMAQSINNLISRKYDIGIVGGGTFEKIIYQLDNLVIPYYIFSECGSVYHKLNKELNQYELINKNNLRLEPEYIKINKLVKESLKFISSMDYLISGNFIDLRNGLIYISLVGMSANDEERTNFIELDKIYKFREKLIDILTKYSEKLNLNEYLSICEGGSVGIGIYPKKWDKIQVLNWINNYDNIYFFGDKYTPGGNDYELMQCSQIIPYPTNSLEQTMDILDKI